MKIQLGKYLCGNCGASFEAPLLGASVYGEFLLWSRNGYVAYLNAIEDRTYKETSAAIALQYPELAADPNRKADILQALYGPTVCDPDPIGAPYRIGGKPTCPNCVSIEITSWASIFPPKVVDWDIPAVSHERWQNMTSESKTDALKEGVAAAGYP